MSNGTKPPGNVVVTIATIGDRGIVTEQKIKVIQCHSLFDATTVANAVEHRCDELIQEYKN